MGVLNEGINGNRLTRIRMVPGRGQPAVDRFERDVLERPGTRAVVIFEGTNDIAAGASATNIYADMTTLVARAHARSLGFQIMADAIPLEALVHGNGGKCR